MIYTCRVQGTIRVEARNADDAIMSITFTDDEMEGYLHRENEAKVYLDYLIRKKRAEQYYGTSNPFPEEKKG